MKFTKALVRRPCANVVHGLATLHAEQPDFQKALGQHDSYIDALKRCGLTVTVLPADEEFPDSTFVEDTALLTPECAILMNPRAPSRNGEVVAIEQTLRQMYSRIERVSAPGTADAGDIMAVGTHYYIGLSTRTNNSGSAQIIEILGRYGYTGSTIPLQHALHLKSGVAYLENNLLVVADEFRNNSAFTTFHCIEAPEQESFGANCVWINGTVLLPTHCPELKSQIVAHGLSVLELDVSEFQKLDGGLSCLSLRY
ncbi:MAG: arginine deiminase-related protein [bacterium]